MAKVRAHTTGVVDDGVLVCRSDLLDPLFRLIGVELSDDIIELEPICLIAIQTELVLRFEIIGILESRLLLLVQIAL